MIIDFTEILDDLEVKRASLLAPEELPLVGVAEVLAGLDQPYDLHEVCARCECLRLLASLAQLVEDALQVLQLLSGLAEFALGSQPLVVGQISGGRRNQRVDVRGSL